MNNMIAGASLSRFVVLCEELVFLITFAQFRFQRLSNINPTSIECFYSGQMMTRATTFGVLVLAKVIA